MGVDFENNFSCIFSKLQGLCEFEKKISPVFVR